MLMGGLVVHTPTGDVEVPSGGHRTVGRNGDIVLGKNPYLHGVAFTLYAFSDRWEIAVEPEKLEVTVYDATSEHRHIVHPGEQRAFRYVFAEVTVHPFGGIERVAVNASALETPARQHGSTLAPPFQLDTANPHHRVFIAACRDRLQSRAGALTHAEVSELLRSAGHWEDRSLTEVAAKKRASRAAPELRGWMENWGVSTRCESDEADRDAIVDFLVRCRIVTHESYKALFAGAAR
jgi:hypothetical protein